GDPADEKTDVGPLIDEAAAIRVEEWIKEAVGRGAKLWAGGNRKGDFLPPALLENAPADCRLSCEEAFGPVATLEAFDSRERALDRLAEGRYGLQAGIFSNDLAFVHRAFERLSVGGLIVNDVPTYRADAAPYGGARDSGLGREGVRWAIEEYTERKTLVIKP
ncbi:MAG TPA: aldehyde dehydrogenase family protein, partial [Elusimicrobiota bacterium]|nr:aldehyde dehydrogenase family protein [Elusimicrobiota bacterium]